MNATDERDANRVETGKVKPIALIVAKVALSAVLIVIPLIIYFLAVSCAQ